MRWNRIMLAGACILLAVAGLSTMQWRGFQHLAETHETFTVRRINRLADKLLGEARRTKDDILLQQTVQAIAFMPGVSWAAMVDPDNKILAHSDPSQLGKMLRSRTRSGQWMHVLEDGRQEWGKFVFGFSDPSFRRMVDHQTIRPILLFVIFGFIGFGLSLVIEKSRQMNDAKMGDSAVLLEEEKARSVRLEGEVQKALSQGQALMQGALSHFPEAVLFLDSQQRIAAINNAALGQLGFSRMDDALHKSWHEVPLLQSCGPLLEQSLQSPTAVLQTSAPANKAVMSFVTLEGGFGTWVRLSGAKAIV